MYKLVKSFKHHNAGVTSCIFHPEEFILFSAGFDAHQDDPLAQLKLDSIDFYTITKRTLEATKKFCSGKVVSILEGGYDLNALVSSTEKHVDALTEFV